MSYLLDADWAISFLNGRPEAIELVDRLVDEGIALSIIVWGEIYEGLLGQPQFEIRLAQLRRLTEMIDLLSPDTKVATHYGRIRAERTRPGAAPAGQRPLDCCHRDRP